MNAPKDIVPIANFRDSKWRYSQFVILGVIVAALVKWLSSLTWVPSLLIGTVVAVGYFLLEKRRGVI